MVDGGGRGRVKPKGDESDQNIDTTSRNGNYRMNNLAYDMLCKPVCSDNSGKEGDKLTCNRLFNIQKLTTNKRRILLRQQCARYKAL